MRIPLLPVLLLVVLPTFAAALTFEEVDTDGDGLISADEAANVEGLEFEAADADNDGTLSVDEYEIALENLAPPEEGEPTAAAAPEAKPEEPAPSSGAVQPAAPVTPAKPGVANSAPVPTPASAPSAAKVDGKPPVAAPATPKP
ncbi:MAG: hypothetical protein WAT67_04935 [Candidatus Contendobacter sp.]